MTYQDFLAAKLARVHETGVTVTDHHPMLHQWQTEIVTWAAHVGRAAIWADTGLGKTIMQVEWLRHMIGPTGYGLIVAPLAVCHQTVREAAKIDVPATYVRDASQMAGPGVYVTNYEMVQHFDPTEFRAVVLDEASGVRGAGAILANFGVSDSALMDVLTGKFKPQGKLPFALANNLDAVVANDPDAPGYPAKDTLYPFGFGLTYK